MVNLPLPPSDVDLDKTLGSATVRKLASKQALRVRGTAMLITVSYLTAFWHVRSFHFILELNRT